MAWTIGNRYLSQVEMQGNAMEVYKYFHAKGWSVKRYRWNPGETCEKEFNINPGIWQSLNAGNYSGGFGLVQWTPATQFSTNWASANGYGIRKSLTDSSIGFIRYLTIPSGQWIATTAYPLSFFEQFRVSKDSPEYLASAFLKNFERAGVEVEAERRACARKWYDYLVKNRGRSDISATKKL